MIAKTNAIEPTLWMNTEDNNENKYWTLINKSQVETQITSWNNYNRWGDKGVGEEEKEIREEDSKERYLESRNK